MKQRIIRALRRAQYAAMGAAIGAFVGGLFGRSTASTGAATGALVGAVVGEKRHDFDAVIESVREERGKDEDSEGRLARLRESAPKSDQLRRARSSE